MREIIKKNDLFLPLDQGKVGPVGNVDTRVCPCVVYADHNCWHLLLQHYPTETLKCEQ